MNFEVRYITNAPGTRKWQARNTAEPARDWVWMTASQIRSLVTREEMARAEANELTMTWPLPTPEECAAKLAETIRWDTKEKLWWQWYDRKDMPGGGCWDHERDGSYVHDYVIGGRLDCGPWHRKSLPRGEYQRRKALLKPIICLLKSSHAVTTKPTDTPPKHAPIIKMVLVPTCRA